MVFSKEVLVQPNEIIWNFLTTTKSNTMKNLFLFLLTLIVLPVWAGDATVTPAPQKPAALTTGISVYIDFKGSAKNILALVSDFEKDAAYQTAECSIISVKKSAKITRIMCTKANDALLTFLSSHASAKAHWSISAAICPTGCTLMNCPPPNGSWGCCKKTSTGYQVCWNSQLHRAGWCRQETVFVPFLPYLKSCSRSAVHLCRTSYIRPRNYFF